MDMLTSDERNDESMEETRGIWVRHNLSDDSIEIWHDGQFQVSWADHSKHKLEHRITTMLRSAVEIGGRKAFADLRKLIGAK